jgi:hypothetical protein
MLSLNWGTINWEGINWGVFNLEVLGMRRLRTAIVGIIMGALCVSLAACWPQSEAANTTPAPPSADPAVNQCIGNLFPNYSPRNLDQCVKACLSCERGAMTTCSTSCRLKGAS